MTEPYFADDRVTLYGGDALAVLAELPDASVDAVVTDPPYGLEFMGKAWDTADGFQDWCEAWARECLRVLKPGGHLLAFGGSRTWHRLACAVEDAGFEVRDSIAWLYGSGFPKSMDVSKAIDKAAGAQGAFGGPKTAVHAGWIERGRMRADEGHEGWQRPWVQDAQAVDRNAREYLPATDNAAHWQGWGTALKPAFEPVVVARKPLIGTVAANVLAHGTGALNIDGCRVEGAFESGWSKSGSKASHNDSMSGRNYARDPRPDNVAGRWPANVVLDEHQAAELDKQSGEQRDGVAVNRNRSDDEQASWFGTRKSQVGDDVTYGGAGGASRFFYVAKADSAERVRVNGVAHPTVKPLELMRWLVRLVTPPGGVVLEPFAGSGTTVEACLLEGFRCIAIERETDYLPLVTQRIRRRRDPIAYLAAAGDDLGLFALDQESA